MRRPERQGGQGVVEFTLVLPIILVLVLSVAELGLVFGKMSSLGYGTREGARTGSALAQGYPTDCLTDPDNYKVDALVVAAVQRILQSPDSGIDLSKVQEIRIFEATATGAELPGNANVNVWKYTNTPWVEVDPGPGVAKIAFYPVTPIAWNACDRINGGPGTQSIGVTVRYRSDFVTPLPSLINAISGGDFWLDLTETTVMALNPTN